MSVYKEGFYAVKKIKDKITKVYLDAADVAAPVEKGSRTWNNLKQLIEWYGVEGTREEGQWGDMKYVTQTVELINEWAVTCHADIPKHTTRYKVTYFSLASVSKIKRTFAFRFAHGGVMLEEL